MKKLFSILFLISPSFIFLGCIAFAPFSNPYTARSNGQDKISLDIGTTHLSQHYIRLGVGLTKDWDLGGLFENGSLGNMMGLWTKYSFINKEKDFSLALEGGYGITILFGSGSYYYLGPIISYRLKQWDFYAFFRYNYVKMDKTDWKTDSELIGDIYIPSWHYDYFTATLGVSYWFTKEFGLNLNVSTIGGGDLNTGSDLLLGGSLLFHF